MLDFNTRKIDGRLGQAMDAAMESAHRTREEERLKTRPPRLGASRIAENCVRKLQYEYFKSEPDKPLEARTLRIFQRGHEGEKWVAEWMREAGFTLMTEKQDGGQFCFSAAGGKLLGFADGVLTAGADAFGPYPRLWENKVLGAKGFGKLEKEKLKKSYPVYYGQIQVYMAYFGLAEHPALFTALNANDMEIYAENVEFDGAEAQRLSDRAVNIISACEAGELLPRNAQREDYYECKYCDYAKRCWGMP